MKSKQIQNIVNHDTCAVVLIYSTNEEVGVILQELPKLFMNGKTGNYGKKCNP